MLEILKRINESGLSPNQYFLLFAMKSGLEVKNIDEETELNVLKDGGYLSEDNKLISLELSEQALRMRAIQFCQLFPPIHLPGTNIHARGKLSPVMQKLKIFMANYNYSWTTIVDAAQRYVARYREKNYSYMQTASTFIIDKNGDSTLALECDTLEYSEDSGISI